MRSRFGLGVVGWLVGCASPAPVATTPAEAPAPAPEGQVEAAPSADEPSAAVAQMLERVARARGLTVEGRVAASQVSRSEAIAHIIEKTEREVPRSVLDAQGELLRAFGLIPPSYDFVDGIYALIRNNIAGFYDQHDKRMFLLDDLSQSGDEETLAHELAHALQDQHHDLVTLLRYRPGHADRIAAAHSLCEGDATAATVATIYGDAARVDADQLRLGMLMGVAFAEGASTPRVLQLALVSPYVDGFRFVEELRARGGWSAVDAAFARLPVSTEQLLHLDKYEAREPPIEVAAPPLPGPSFAQVDADVLGEQGLRLAAEVWTTPARAEAAAAGWGGDRYVVGRREVGSGGEHAAAWVIVFDDEAQAREAISLVEAKLPTGCRERSDLGPLALARRGATIVLAAGPYSRNGDTFASAGNCKGALRWVDTIFESRQKGS